MLAYSLMLMETYNAQNNASIIRQCLIMYGPIVYGPIVYGPIMYGPIVYGQHRK